MISKILDLILPAAIAGATSFAIYTIRKEASAAVIKTQAYYATIIALVASLIQIIHSIYRGTLSTTTRGFMR